jgi:simple sugar transport system ATP-binding protein
MEKLTLWTRNVSIEFPGVKALTDTILSRYRRDPRGVMGANGAGKPTLMKCSRSQPGLNGRVYLNDRVVDLRTTIGAK